MTNVIKALALTAALTLTTVGVPTLHALAVPGFQDHDDHHDRDRNRQDHSSYYSNDSYRLGNREGYEDYQKKQQRKEHNHQFRSDNDRQAHDYGYQDGWQGHQYGNSTQRPH